MRAFAKRRRTILLPVALVLGRVAAARAQSEPLVDIRDLTPQEHRTAGFVLTAPRFLQIEATGAGPRRGDGDSWWARDDEIGVWPAAAWILNARTRRLVWDLRVAETTGSRDGLRRFSGLIRLPAGVYEAHFGSYVATSVSRDGRSGDLGLLGRKGRRIGGVDYRGPLVDDGSFREFALRIDGAGRRTGDRELRAAARAFTASAIVSLRPDAPGKSGRMAFELGRPADVEIYAIGELREGGAFDFGWIENAETRRPVWRMEFQRTEEGGGARRNRVLRDTLHLAAGRYVAYFASDESHGPGAWTAVPPFDPVFWGLTLRVADPAARASARRLDWEPVPAGQTIVSLTRLGDNELRSQGFTLRRAMDLRIYALGECSSNEEMNDFAWIMDAATRRRVWVMRCENTEPAGGAEKNRLFDGAIRLEAGSYRVYYKSDGSHSFRKWNAAPPVESRYWGVSLFPASGKLDRGVVGPFERDTSGILAELVRVRNAAQAQGLFSLDRPSTVRVYAVGEGVGEEMVDYGSIEDERSGDIVWRMQYQATTPAGGARKNRRFDGTVRLPAGRYVLRFRTDGSHAYGAWNADPPDDPESWGITVRRAD